MFFEHYTPRFRGFYHLSTRRIGFSLNSVFRLGLFLKIFLLSASISLVALTTGYSLLANEMDRHVRHLLKSESVLFLDELSHVVSVPILNADRLTIDDILRTYSHHDGVEEILIYGRNGDLLGDSLNGEIPSFLKHNLSPRNNPSLFFTHSESLKYDLASKTVFFGKVPIGTISVYFSDKPYRIVHKEVLSSFIALGVVSVFLSLGGSIFLSRYLTKRIRNLYRATMSLKHGDFTVNLKQDGHDELGDLTQSFNSMVKELRHKELLQNALIRYVSKDVAERIILHPELIHLGGMRQQVVVLFADIRNFTRLSNQLSPEQVVTILNDYYQSLIEIVFKYQGSINNIMGDGVMVVFGIPEYFEEHPKTALECAFGMMEAIREKTFARRSKGLPVAEFGMGLHVGDGIVGNIGSGARMEYTVVGQTVNIASRIETLAKPGEILVSSNVVERVSRFFQFSDPLPVSLKGLDEPILVSKLIEKIPDSEMAGSGHESASLPLSSSTGSTGG